MRRPAFSMNLSPRDRRALRLGALLVAPVLAYALLARPYVASVQSARSALARERDLLAREQALVDETPSFPARIRATGAVLAGETQRLYGDRDAVSATAALAREVGGMLKGAGVSLQQVDARADTVLPGGIRELTIEVRAEGDFQGILAALAAMESGRRLLRVGQVGIVVGASSGVFQAALGAPGAPGMEVLSFTATVHGYSVASSDSLPQAGAGAGARASSTAGPRGEAVR